MKDKTIERIKKDGIETFLKETHFAKQKIKHLMKKNATVS